MTPGDVLRSAAARVRSGWTQGDFSERIPQAGLHNAVLGLRETTVVCAMGGVALVVGGFGVHEIVALDWLRVAIGTDHITGWNDAPGQTAENVATALEYAALLADEYAAQAASEPAHVLADTRLVLNSEAGPRGRVKRTSDVGGLRW